MDRNRGFFKIIGIVVVGVALLFYFHIDVKSILDYVLGKIEMIISLIQGVLNSK